jgi:hypothetical protein
MHHGRSLEYQFTVVPLRDTMSDFVRVASSPSDKAITALWHIKNYRGLVSPWYFGGAAALHCGGHNASVISWSKEAESKLPYVCLGSYITRMMTHHGKIVAMFDYLNRALSSYINDPGSQKYYRAANNGSLSVAQLPHT